jgi:hypothetical protein
MELHLEGAGSATVCLFDAKGNLLMTKRWTVSGSGDVGVKSHLPTKLRTKAALLPVVPVLIIRTNAEQRITIDGKDAALVTAERSRAMKVSKAGLAKIDAVVQSAELRSRNERTTLSAR